MGIEDKENIIYVGKLDKRRAMMKEETKPSTTKEKHASGMTTHVSTPGSACHVHSFSDTKTKKEEQIIETRWVEEVVGSSPEKEDPEKKGLETEDTEEGPEKEDPEEENGGEEEDALIVEDQEEEEIFFGKVTEKEKRKASKYDRRKTAVFKTGFRQDRKLMRYTMDPSQLAILNEGLDEEEENDENMEEENDENMEEENGIERNEDELEEEKNKEDIANKSEKEGEDERGYQHEKEEIQEKSGIESNEEVGKNNVFELKEEKKDEKDVKHVKHERENDENKSKLDEKEEDCENSLMLGQSIDVPVSVQSAETCQEQQSHDITKQTDGSLLQNGLDTTFGEASQTNGEDCQIDIIDISDNSNKKIRGLHNDEITENRNSSVEDEIETSNEKSICEVSDEADDTVGSGLKCECSQMKGADAMWCQCVTRETDAIRKIIHRLSLGGEQTSEPPSGNKDSSYERTENTQTVASAFSAFTKIVPKSETEQKNSHTLESVSNTDAEVLESCSGPLIGKRPMSVTHVCESPTSPLAHSPGGVGVSSLTPLPVRGRSESPLTPLAVRGRSESPSVVFTETNFSPTLQVQHSHPDSGPVIYDTPSPVAVSRPGSLNLFRSQIVPSAAAVSVKDNDTFVRDTPSPKSTPSGQASNSEASPIHIKSADRKEARRRQSQNSGNVSLYFGGLDLDETMDIVDIGQMEESQSQENAEPHSPGASSNDSFEMLESSFSDQRVNGFHSNLHNGIHSNHHNGVCSPRDISSGAPVYKDGTPRFPRRGPGGASAGEVGEPPMFNLDSDSSTSRETSPEYEGQEDVSNGQPSMSDILEKKKAQLQQLREEKKRLQSKLHTKQSSPMTVRKSPMVPTSADSLPRVRYKDSNTLALRDRELEAVTKLHTLCNSQRSVKFISKPRKAAGIKTVTVVAKEASRLHWPAEVVSQGLAKHRPLPAVQAKPILSRKSMDKVYPYNDESPTVVVISRSRKGPSSPLSKAKV